MRKRVAGLALPVVIAIGVAVTSCGSAPGTVKPLRSATRSASAASPVASGPAGSVPAGYQRVGGAAQGISLAVPATWAVFDLSKESPQSVVSKVDANHGMYTAQLLQNLEQGQKLHAIWAYDSMEAALQNPNVANLNFTCGPSGTTDVGAAGIPFLKEALGYMLGTIQATHITWKDLKIGGVPGVEVFSQYTSPGYGTTYSVELDALPKPNTDCEVTADVGQGESLDSIMTVAAATAQFL